MTNTQKNAILKILIDRDGGAVKGDKIANDLGLKTMHVMNLIQDFGEKGYLDYIVIAGYSLHISMRLDGIEFYDKGGYEMNKSNTAGEIKDSNNNQNVNQEMYYQIVVELKYDVNIPGGDRTLYMFDLKTLVDIETGIMRPYIRSQRFMINGRSLNRDMVDTLRILASDNSIKENFDLARTKNPRYLGSREELLQNETYYNDITFKVHGDVQQKIDSEERNLLTTPSSLPDELTQPIRKYRNDYPQNQKTAFIIMQFSKTKLHDEIVKQIKDVLKKHSIIGLRADDKEYTDDLFNNIRTYIHCSDFAIAVFERIQKEDFNPNVSLEVGYMIGMGKQICLLKDKTLKSLQSDLVGKLYKPFDTQDIANTLPEKIEKWMQDKGII